MSVYVEDWAASFGSPWLANPEESQGPAGEVVEDAKLRFHAPTKSSGAARSSGAVSSLGAGRGKNGIERLAFVDGVRRGDVTLFHYDAETGESARGVAGSHAAGAVRIEGDGPAHFGDAVVQRLVIWGSGHFENLPKVRGGFEWKVSSIADATPEAPLAELQRRMRLGEAELAESLCKEGFTTIVDGPFFNVRSRDLPIVGYIKTHHRAYLPPEEHRKIVDLGPGQRTSLFRLGTECYSAYLRLVPRSPAASPWAGIVRIQLPQSTGLEEAVRTANLVTATLPRYAGVAHRDPRAPQNLQPIGALESHLKHLLGDPGLSIRAVRDAVAVPSKTVRSGSLPASAIAAPDDDDDRGWL